MLFNYLEREKTVHPVPSLDKKQAAEGSGVAGPRAGKTAKIIGKMSSGVKEWLGCLLTRTGSQWLCLIRVEVLITAN